MNQKRLFSVLEVIILIVFVLGILFFVATDILLKCNKAVEHGAKSFVNKYWQNPVQHSFITVVVLLGVLSELANVTIFFLIFFGTMTLPNSVYILNFVMFVLAPFVFVWGIHYFRHSLLTFAH